MPPTVPSTDVDIDDTVDPNLDGEIIEGEDEEDRPGRPVHPAVASDDKDVYPFRFPAKKVERDGKVVSEADEGNFPADYDLREHAPLKKKDFGNDYSYFTYKAMRARAEADRFQRKADEALQLGGITTDADAKRLIKLTQKMSELRSLLEAKGMNPDELLAEFEALGKVKAGS